MRRTLVLRIDPPRISVERRVFESASQSFVTRARETFERIGESWERVTAPRRDDEAPLPEELHAAPGNPDRID